MTQSTTGPGWPLIKRSHTGHRLQGLASWCFRQIAQPALAIDSRVYVRVLRLGPKGALLASTDCYARSSDIVVTKVGGSHSRPRTNSDPISNGTRSTGDDGLQSAAWPPHPSSMGRASGLTWRAAGDRSSRCPVRPMAPLEARFRKKRKKKKILPAGPCSLVPGLLFRTARGVGRGC